MIPLRQRMIEDMQLRNLSAGTQRALPALHYRPGAILSNQPRTPEAGRTSRIPAVYDQRAALFARVGQPLRDVR